MMGLRNFGRWLLLRNGPPNEQEADLAASVDEVFNGATLEAIAEENLVAARIAYQYLRSVIIPVMQGRAELSDTFRAALQSPSFQSYWAGILFWTTRTLGDGFYTLAQQLDMEPVRLLTEALAETERELIADLERTKGAPTGTSA
jgi:hypothetical protein